MLDLYIHTLNSINHLLYLHSYISFPELFFATSPCPPTLPLHVCSTPRLPHACIATVPLSTAPTNSGPRRPPPVQRQTLNQPTHKLSARRPPHRVRARFPRSRVPTSLYGAEHPVLTCRLQARANGHHSCQSSTQKRAPPTPTLPFHYYPIKS